MGENKGGKCISPGLVLIQTLKPEGPPPPFVWKCGENRIHQITNLLLDFFNEVGLLIETLCAVLLIHNVLCFLDILYHADECFSGIPISCFSGHLVLCFSGHPILCFSGHPVPCFLLLEFSLFLFLFQTLRLQMLSHSLEIQ